MTKKYKVSTTYFKLIEQPTEGWRCSEYEDDETEIEFIVEASDIKHAEHKANDYLRYQYGLDPQDDGCIGTYEDKTITEIQ